MYVLQPEKAVPVLGARKLGLGVKGLRPIVFFNTGLQTSEDPLRDQSLLSLGSMKLKPNKIRCPNHNIT